MFIPMSVDNDSLRSPRRPERRLPRILWAGDFGQPNACRRGPWLAAPRTATPRAPCRKPPYTQLGEAVSMSHHQRSLVLVGVFCKVPHRKPPSCMSDRNDFKTTKPPPANECAFIFLRHYALEIKRPTTKCLRRHSNFRTSEPFYAISTCQAVSRSLRQNRAPPSSQSIY